MSKQSIKNAIEQSYKNAIDAKLNETYNKYKDGQLATFAVDDGYFLSKLDKVMQQQKKVS